MATYFDTKWEALKAVGLDNVCLPYAFASIEYGATVDCHAENERGETIYVSLYRRDDGRYEIPTVYRTETSESESAPALESSQVVESSPLSALAHELAQFIMRKRQVPSYAIPALSVGVQCAMLATGHFIDDTKAPYVAFDLREALIGIG